MWRHRHPITLDPTRANTQPFMLCLRCVHVMFTTSFSCSVNKASWCSEDTTLVTLRKETNKSRPNGQISHNKMPLETSDITAPLADAIKNLQQPGQTPVNATAVKLPSFWQGNPQVWFRQGNPFLQQETLPSQPKKPNLNMLFRH